MTDRVFTSRTFVRVDTDPAQWLVVEAGRTLGTAQTYTTFDTFEAAQAAGYDGENVTVEVPLEDRLALLEVEMRAMKGRAAAAEVTGDARKIRDAVVGD
jgi:predicted RNase H-like nuclease